MNGRFLINRQQGKLLGVAAGIADWTGVDVLVVRLSLIALTFLTGPLVILFYLLAGWLAAER